MLSILRHAALPTLFLSALAPWPAWAALPSGQQAGALRATAPAGIRLAQDGGVEIFYDKWGRRILLDRETGEVVAVEPPRRKRMDPDLRREMRRRELRRDGYRIVDPEDADRYAVRRLPAPDEEYEPYPGDGERIARSPGGRSPRPDDPDAQYMTPDGPEASDDDQVVRDEPIERQPLDDVLTAKPSAVPRDTSARTAEAAPDGSDADAGSIVEPAAPSVDGSNTASTPPASDAANPAVQPQIMTGVREEVAALQVLLDRGGASPGVIDGRFGGNVDKALAAYNQINNQNLKSTDAVAIQAALAETGGDPFTTYTLTPVDVAGPFVASVPADYGVKAQLERLGYTSVTEMLGERFHMDETYLKSLNPGTNFNRAGSVIRVAQVGPPKAGEVVRITADKVSKQVHGYDADGRLVVSYPATIGSPDTPSPSGIHAVARIAFDPEYTYNPKINFQQGANDKVLRIPPGPNGPVGAIWIALDKPTYGIHGTPEPSRIGKAESHGCVRLTNWDAAELAKMVKPGVPVEFVE